VCEWLETVSNKKFFGLVGADVGFGAGKLVSLVDTISWPIEFTVGSPNCRRGKLCGNI
jgi:hypothetical protein